MKRIIYDYDKPHIVGRARRTFPLAGVIVLIIAVTLTLALIYILFFKKDSVTYESKEFFAVVQKCNGIAESKSVAEEMKARGGGGYLTDSFTVVVAVYPMEADAFEVADRYGYDVESVGKSHVKITLGDNETNKKIKNICILPEKIYDILYETVILLDRGDLSPAAASKALDDVSALVNQGLKELSGIKEKFASDKLITEIENTLTSISSSVNRESLYSLSSCLKYTLAEIVFIYKSMLNCIS